MSQLPAAQRRRILRARPGAQECVRLHGPVLAYEYDNNGRGSMRRRVFCAKCGSPIHGGNPAEDFVTLSASSLDDPSLFTPREIIHHDEARPWDHTALG